MSERIAKFMARSGVCSRREAEELIRQKRVTVNGEIVASPALNVDGSEKILLDGEKLPAVEATRLWLYYKPVGLLTTHKDTDRAASLSFLKTAGAAVIKLKYTALLTLKNWPNWLTASLWTVSVTARSRRNLKASRAPMPG